MTWNGRRYGVQVFRGKIPSILLRVFNCKSPLPFFDVDPAQTEYVQRPKGGSRPHTRTLQVQHVVRLPDSHSNRLSDNDDSLFSLGLALITLSPILLMVCAIYGSRILRGSQVTW